MLCHSDGCDKFGAQRSREPYKADHAHSMVSVKREKTHLQACPALSSCCSAGHQVPQCNYVCRYNMYIYIYIHTCIYIYIHTLSSENEWNGMEPNRTERDEMK